MQIDSQPPVLTSIPVFATEATIMRNLSFTEHPQTVGETYGQHLRVAAGFSFQMIRGGLACLVHGVFPFLCTTTGSSTIRRLHEQMVLHRAATRAEVASLTMKPNHAEPAPAR
jgi:Family of unknown function (DUF6356)